MRVNPLYATDNLFSLLIQCPYLPPCLISKGGGNGGKLYDIFIPLGGAGSARDMAPGLTISIKQKYMTEKVS